MASAMTQLHCSAVFLVLVHAFLFRDLAVVEGCSTVVALS